MECPRQIRYIIVSSMYSFFDNSAQINATSNFKRAFTLYTIIGELNFILKFTFHYVKGVNELYFGSSLTCST